MRTPRQIVGAVILAGILLVALWVWNPGDFRSIFGAEQTQVQPAAQP